MRKEYATEARNRLHNLYQDLTIQGFTSKQPKTMQAVQWIISCAGNFDSGFGKEMQSAWEKYKRTGLHFRSAYSAFMELVYKLDADLDTYFRSEWHADITADQSYVNTDILKGFQAKSGPFNYTKLVTLIEEVNFNHSQDKVYASCALLRAILDHIPPLLGKDNLEMVVSQHNWGSQKSSQRKAIQDLLSFRNTFDAVMHSHISKGSDIIDITYLPNKFAINTLLMACLESEIQPTQIKSSNNIKVQSGNKPTKTPDHYPAVGINITSSGGKPYGFTLSFVNNGDKPAILEELHIGESINVSLNTQNMLPANNEARQYGTLSLEGSDTYDGSTKNPHLSLIYRDMAGTRYKSVYDIQTKKRADGFFSVEGLANLNIEVI